MSSGRVSALIAATALATIALAAPATAGLPTATESLGKSGGLEYGLATNPAVTNPETTTAACAANRNAVGGGATIGGPIADGKVTASAPTSTAATSWEGSAHSISGNPLQARSYSVCSKSEVEIETQTTGIGTTTEVGHSPACEPGLRVVGGGASANGGAIEIRSSHPFDAGSDADTQPDDGWETRLYNSSGGSVTVTSYVICSATLKPRYVLKNVNLGPTSGRSGKVKCPRNTVASSGGFETELDARLNDSRPIDTGDAGKVPDDGWSVAVHNPVGLGGSVSLGIVCLKP